MGGEKDRAVVVLLERRGQRARIQQRCLDNSLESMIRRGRRRKEENERKDRGQRKEVKETLYLSQHARGVAGMRPFLEG